MTEDSASDCSTRTIRGDEVTEYLAGRSKRHFYKVRSSLPAKKKPVKKYEKKDWLLSLGMHHFRSMERLYGWEGEARKAERVKASFKELPFKRGPRPGASAARQGISGGTSVSRMRQSGRERYTDERWAREAFLRDYRNFSVSPLVSAYWDSRFAEMLIEDDNFTRDWKIDGVNPELELRANYAYHKFVKILRKLRRKVRAMEKEPVDLADFQLLLVEQPAVEKTVDDTKLASIVAGQSLSLEPVIRTEVVEKPAKVDTYIGRWSGNKWPGEWSDEDQSWYLMVETEVQRRGQKAVFAPGNESGYGFKEFKRYSGMSRAFSMAGFEVIVQTSKPELLTSHGWDSIEGKVFDRDHLCLPVYDGFGYWVSGIRVRSNAPLCGFFRGHVYVERRAAGN